MYTARLKKFRRNAKRRSQKVYFLDKEDSAILLCFECTLNSQISIKIVGAVFRKINIYFWSENFFRRTMHFKFSVVNIADPPSNTFSKQVSNSVQQSFVEITKRLFEKAVPIHFVNYFTTNNILWT